MHIINLSWFNAHFFVMLSSMISPTMSFMYRTLEYEAHTASLDKYIKREANTGINAGLHDFMKKQ